MHRAPLLKLIESYGERYPIEEKTISRYRTFISNNETFQSPESVNLTRTDTLNATSSFEDEEQIPQDVNPPQQQE